MRLAEVLGEEPSCFDVLKREKNRGVLCCFLGVDLVFWEFCFLVLIDGIVWLLFDLGIFYGCFVCLMMVLLFGVKYVGA